MIVRLRRPPRIIWKYHTSIIIIIIIILGIICSWSSLADFRYLRYKLCKYPDVKMYCLVRFIEGNFKICHSKQITNSERDTGVSVKYRGCRYVASIVASNESFTYLQDLQRDLEQKVSVVVEHVDNSSALAGTFKSWTTPQKAKLKELFGDGRSGICKYPPRAVIAQKIKTVPELIGKSVTSVVSKLQHIMKLQKKDNDTKYMLSRLDNKQFIFLTCSPNEIFSATKTKKKSVKTTTESSITTTSQPAIIALEIVDPNENSTSSKQSKRTIESSLGYGYNNFDSSKPRYEVYKYSQHDIPPYKGDVNQLPQSIPSNNQVNVQKSVQYVLPPVSHQASASSSLLQPGTTLYSSLSGSGKVSGLSINLPKVQSLEYDNNPVPVVVLRIYPNQLKDSTIQAKLPKSHPYAKTINSLNIQTLLLQYIKTLKHPGTLSQYSINQESFRQHPESPSQYPKTKGSLKESHGYRSQYSVGAGLLENTHGLSSNYYKANKGFTGQYRGSANQYSSHQALNHGYTNQYPSGHNTYSSNQGLTSPIKGPVKTAQTNYQTSNYYNPNSYQNIPMYQNNNAGGQNYMYYQQTFPQQPLQEYTRESQYQQQQYPDYDSGVTVVKAPIKYEISPYQTGQEWSYQTSVSPTPQVSKTSAPTQQPEYYYIPQAITKNSYSTESSNYYQPAQQLEYSKQTVKTAAVPDQQSNIGNDASQYSGYYQDAGQQYRTNNQKLLTFENYPTNKHTRVVFKTKSGHVRTPEQDTTSPKEIQTINIHVPENVANVEVQETERPYHAPEPYTDTIQETKDQGKEQSAGVYQQNVETEKSISQDNYYLPPEALHQGYYNSPDSASEVMYKYQNVNFDDMAKYFEKRGAMPKYFFQASEDTEDVKKATDDKTNLMSAYEEAAFPSTSSSPVTKKVKSKKRTPI